MAERGPAVPHRAGVEWREGNRSDSPRAGGERRSDRRPPERPSSERRERGWRSGDLQSRTALESNGGKGIALTRREPEARGGLTEDHPSRHQASGASEDGGEGGNRTHPSTQSAEATILKTVTTTRHVSLSVLHAIAHHQTVVVPRRQACS